MEQAFDGLLVLDKPQGITSREAVDQAARWFPRRTRIGHTGTLDPLATGVLVLCLDGATRLTEYVQRMGKTYRSRFRLGATSDTDDADGTVTPVPNASDPGEAAVRAALTTLTGSIDQVPPAYSAARVTGRRAYALARRGEEVDLAPRRIEVYAIDLLSYTYPDLEVEVRCGKGTYIRSLARDLGQRLGCGGHVATLRRSRVGPFMPEQAVPLTAERLDARARLLSPALALAELPRLALPPAEVERLCHGQKLPAQSLAQGLRGEVAIFAADGQPAVIARIDAEVGLIRPVKVLA